MDLALEARGVSRYADPGHECSTMCTLTQRAMTMPTPFNAVRPKCDGPAQAATGIFHQATMTRCESQNQHRMLTLVKQMGNFARPRG